jgi:hypothetical protein
MIESCLHRELGLKAELTEEKLIYILTKKITVGVYTKSRFVELCMVNYEGDENSSHRQMLDPKRGKPFNLMLDKKFIIKIPIQPNHKIDIQKVSKEVCERIVWQLDHKHADVDFNKFDYFFSGSTAYLGIDESSFVSLFQFRYGVGKAERTPGDGITAEDCE